MTKAHRDLESNRAQIICSRTPREETLQVDYDSKEIDLDCVDHGKQKAKIFCLFGKWNSPSCPQCNAEREKAQEIEKAKKKEEENQKMKVLRLEYSLGRAGIPPRFKNHSFDNFIAETDDQKLKLKRCKEYAENFDETLKTGSSMIFCGTTGTGKTHLSCAIANSIIHQGKTAIFMNVLRAIRQVKETWSKSSEKKEQEAIDWFLRCDLLILDEVGVQFGSDTEKMILFEIINERYQNIKPTILISNLSPENLKEFIGERVMDRLKENGGRILQFNWQSHRENN